MFVLRRGAEPEDQSLTAKPALLPANKFRSPLARTPEASERKPDEEEAEVTDESVSLSSGNLSVASGSEAAEARVSVRSGTDWRLTPNNSDEVAAPTTGTEAPADQSSELRARRTFSERVAGSSAPTGPTDRSVPTAENDDERRGECCGCDSDRRGQSSVETGCNESGVKAARVDANMRASRVPSRAPPPRSLPRKLPERVEGTLEMLEPFELDKSSPIEHSI